VLGGAGADRRRLPAFLLFTSNPFERSIPAPPDGNGLNPLLQDPGLAFHPPLLYLGYVGFSMAFSFAVAALIEGRVDAAWARWVRPWTLAAWCFLTSASRSAAGGPITNWAGAAGGSGIRSRTPR
jgi:cytochrome c biogenesis factor